MKQKDLYWMAGIIEGEGTMHTEKKAVILAVQMSDKDIVTRIADLWKNKTIYTYTQGNSEGKNYKTMYSVRRAGYPALMIMQTIYPIMGNRRKEQIEKCFNFYNYDIHKKLPLKSKIGQKITGAQIKNIIKRYEQGESPYKIAKSYPFSGSYLHRICHGKCGRWAVYC